MITQILIQQTLIMFVLMLAGWVLSKGSLLTEKGCGDMGSILLYLVIPCVIIRSYMTDFTLEKLAGLGWSALLAVAAFAVAIAVAQIVFGFRKRLDNFGTAFCNAGFIGIPLVSAVYGKEAAFYIAAFATILNFLQWTYGIIVMTGDRKAINLKKMVLNPVVIALILGLLLFFTGWNLPSIMIGTMDSVAALNTPLAMLILGFYLSKIRIKEMFTDWSAYLSCFLRLIVIPAVTVLVLWIGGHVLPVHNDSIRYSQLAMITLIASSTPIGTTTAIFAQKFGQDYKEAVILVCLSTILSVVTIPLMIMFAQMVIV